MSAAAILAALWFVLCLALAMYVLASDVRRNLATILAAWEGRLRPPDMRD